MLAQILLKMLNSCHSAHAYTRRALPTTQIKEVPNTLLKLAKGDE